MDRNTGDHLRWVRRQNDVPDQVRILLYELAFRANDQGEALATLDQLAATFRKNKSNISRSVNLARRMGLITTYQTSPRDPTTYVLDLDRMPGAITPPAPVIVEHPRKFRRSDLSLPLKLSENLRRLRVASAHTQEAVEEDQYVSTRYLGDAQTQPSTRGTRRAKWHEDYEFEEDLSD